MWILIAEGLVALILTIALTPKLPGTPPPPKGSVPDVADGKRIIRLYGTVWIDNPTQLAMLPGTPIPIRKSGGKK
ncbi:hypothetical protein [Rhodanobacter sp. BL-MT-08]